MTDNQTTQLAPLTGSERVRRTRERKRKGIVFVGFEILPGERDALIRLGLLHKAHRNDKIEVRDALIAFRVPALTRRRRGRSENGAAMEPTMGDPTGTAGASKENSLDVATKGGPKFMARLEQLAEATDRHDAAFVKLQIGQNVQAALDQAQQKLAEAQHELAEAAASRTQAAKTLAEAQANAKAAAKAQAVEAEKIVAMQRQVEKRLELAEARERAATEAIGKAERAEAEANRVRDDLQGRIDNLRTSMRELTLQH